MRSLRAARAAAPAARVHGSSSICTRSGRKSVNSRRSAPLLQPGSPPGAPCSTRDRHRADPAVVAVARLLLELQPERGPPVGHCGRERHALTRERPQLAAAGRVGVDPGHDDRPHAARQRGHRGRDRASRRPRAVGVPIPSRAAPPPRTVALDRGGERRRRRRPDREQCSRRARPSRSTRSRCAA